MMFSFIHEAEIYISFRASKTNELKRKYLNSQIPLGKLDRIGSIGTDLVSL